MPGKPPAKKAPPKPRSAVLRPGLTRLPQLTLWRRAVRSLLRGLMRLLVWLALRAEVRGLENFPAQGPFVVVANHLGDADVPLGLAYTRWIPEVMAKSELYDYPILGWLMDAFGVIWVHRGHADRNALRAALHGLAEGRAVALAPEGRESLTGGLEEGTNGAAYLALKSGVPLLPVTVTGTENSRVYGNLKRLRRTPVTLTVGPLFRLPEGEDRSQAINQGTEIIMRTLASQLPPEYRGIYQFEAGQTNGRE